MPKLAVLPPPPPPATTTYPMDRVFDLPYRLLMLMVPLGTPASVRTAVSPKLIVAVALRPSSTSTWDMVMVPDDGSVITELRR